MRKIIKDTKRHAGFTLVELLLVMAIMLIFFGFVFSTFYLVNSSHAKVVVVNDVKDFTALHMEAITKLIVNADHVVISSDKVTVAAGHTNIYHMNNILNYNNGSGETPAFTYNQYTVAGGGVKWDIFSTFTKSGNMVVIQLDVFDNASSSMTPYYTLTRTVFFPNITKESMIEGGSGDVISYKNFDV